ncbi:MAG: nucleotide-binding protein [Polyangiaceae bacterium]
MCTPGAAQECYSGPAGTNGKGICAAGTQVCNAEGTGYGACNGEVLPKTEDCATPQDEDCDGLAPPCKGQLLWAKRFGDPDGSPSPACRANAVSADPSNNNVLLTGAFNATADFGGGALTTAGANDVFLAVLDPDGGFVRAARYGGADAQAGTGVVYLPDGRSKAVGIFSAALDLGAGTLVCAGSTDLFAASFDSTGAAEWSHGFGDSAPQAPISMAADSAGNVALTGAFFSSIDLGGGLLASAGGSDVFVAKLGPDGVHQWSHRYGDGTAQQGQGVAFDNAGNIVVSGVFSGTIDFGVQKLTSAGASDVYLVKLGPDGSVLWAKRYGDTDLQQNAVVAVDSAGNILFAGSFRGTIDLGGGPMVSAGEADVFLAKLDPDGKHLWSKRFGDSQDQLSMSIAFDVQNNVLLAGAFVGALDFGGGPLASAGGHDVFLAKLDTLGDHVWSKRFGDQAEQYVTAVASDGAGAVLVTGYFTGALDLGGGAMIAKSALSDGFVAKFSP